MKIGNIASHNLANFVNPSDAKKAGEEQARHEGVMAAEQWPAALGITTYD